MDYRLRVGDQLSFVFIDSPSQSIGNYRLMIGDEIAIDSTTAPELRMGDVQQGRGLAIQPDGNITFKLLGEVEAAGLTIPQLRHNLEIRYKDFIREPSIDITPIKTNSLKSAILNSVDARAGTGGQNWIDTVHADGTVRLPKIGAICVLGMTVDEVKREINLRFGRIVAGLEVEPKIAAEAQHFVFVTGEVVQPNRYQLLGPTSVTQAIALAGGHRLGGNLRQIVIFRYAEDWRLLATCIDLKGAMLGKEPTPADNIWLRDSDTIIVPPMPIKQFDNFVKLVFTDGVYGIFPFTGISITRFQGGSVNAN
jgi:polysaccharide biosynthesis/export protein